MTTLDRLKGYGTPAQVRLMLVMAGIMALTGEPIIPNWKWALVMVGIIVLVDLVHAAIDEARGK